MGRCLLVAVAVVAFLTPGHAPAVAAQGEGGTLLVYLDGDGQAGARAPGSGMVAGLEERAARVGWSLFVPVPPGGADTWWRDGASNAGVVAGEVRARAGEVGASRVVLVAYSGGSQLASKWLLPGYPGLVDAAVLVGGGGDPADVGGEAVALSCPVWWVTGVRDTAANAGDGYDAVSDARAGAEAYAAAGSRVFWSSPDMDHSEVREVIPELAVNGLSRLVASDQGIGRE